MKKTSLQQQICVTSISFCKHPTLVARITEIFPNCRLNLEGRFLAGSELKDFMHQSHGAIVGTEIINDELLKQLPNLRIISKYGVGLDNLDLDSMNDRNIALGWTAGVNRRSVSELSLAFMLGCSRNVFGSGTELKSGNWRKAGGRLLSEKTIGIIGCGHIGSDLLKLIKPFNCRILVTDTVDKSLICAAWDATQVDLKTLLRESDVVTLHVPLTEKTRRMVNSDFLSQLRSTAFLINTSRGQIVDETALYDHLVKNISAGAAIDVYEEEPTPNKKLISLENFWGTPHIGGNASEAILAMGNAAIDNLVKAF